MLALIAALALAGDTDLARAARALARADSYAFTVRDSGPGGEVQGRYQRGQPVALRADGVDFFRQGDRLVYRQGDAWQRPRTGTLSDPLPLLGATARVRSVVRLPHEEVTALVQALGGVRADREGGRTVFTGTLDPAAARAFARVEDRDLVQGGTASLRLDERGRMQEYRITVRLQGRRGNAEVDGEAVRTIALSGVGDTKVPVPEAARKALE